MTCVAEEQHERGTPRKSAPTSGSYVSDRVHQNSVTEQINQNCEFELRLTDTSSLLPAADDMKTSDVHADPRRHVSTHSDGVLIMFVIARS